MKFIAIAPVIALFASCALSQRGTVPQLPPLQTVAPAPGLVLLEFPPRSQRAYAAAGLYHLCDESAPRPVNQQAVSGNPEPSQWL